MTTATRNRPLGVLLAPLRLLERSRGWRRRLLIVLYLLVGTILGLLIWRATSLNNLPDVGDPFDVKSFIASSRVPESEDAFVLYRKAGGAMKDSIVTSNYNGLWKSVSGGWAKTPPEKKSASSAESVGGENANSVAHSLLFSEIRPCRRPSFVVPEYKAGKRCLFEVNLWSPLPSGLSRTRPLFFHPQILRKSPKTEAATRHEQ